MLTVNLHPFPVLHTTRLTLRQITTDDAHALFELRADKEVMQFIDRPLAKTISDAQALIQIIDTALKNNDGITWAITVTGEGKLIGTVGYWRMVKEHYRAEIGYLLHTGYQGKGMMSEVLKTIIAYGFDIMKLHSIEANVNPKNTASIKLLEKNNFLREAYFRENFFYNGKFLDSAIYSLVAPVSVT